MRIWFNWKIRILDFLSNRLSNGHVISFALITAMPSTSVQVWKKKEKPFLFAGKGTIKNMRLYMLCFGKDLYDKSQSKRFEKRQREKRSYRPKRSQDACTPTFCLLKSIFIVLQLKQQNQNIRTQNIFPIEQGPGQWIRSKTLRALGPNSFLNNKRARSAELQGLFWSTCRRRFGTPRDPDHLIDT